MNDLAKPILLVTSILFVHLLSHARSADDFKPFKCTDEFKRQDPIKRFAVYQEDLYFFLEDKVLRYVTPKFVFKQKLYYLEAADIFVLDYDKNRPSFLDKPHQIGLVQTDFDEQSTLQSYVIAKEEGEIDVIALNFSLPSIGNFSNSNIALKDTINPDSVFQFIHLTSTRRLEIAFNASKSDEGLLRIVHNQLKPKDVRFNRAYEKQIKFRINSVVYLHLYRYYLDYHRDRASFNGNLVAVGRQKIEFIHVNFYGDVSPYDLDLGHEAQLSLEEFFRCEVPFREPRQMKGIFYKNDTFFVFIDDYYLTVKRDEFVKQGFLLKEVDFTSRRAIPWNKEARFELWTSKWVKAFRNETYLSLHEEPSNKAYMLGVKEDNPDASELVATKIDWLHPFGLNACKRQTLQVENRVYCFSTHLYSYFPIFDPHPTQTWEYNNISDIFKPAGVQLEEPVELIFNYKNNTFIMMTKTEIFTLDYDQVYLHGDKQNELRVNVTVRQQKNCLFNATLGNCPESDFTTPSTVTTEGIASISNDRTGSNSEKEKGLSKKQRILIVAGTLFAMCLILLALCFFVGSRRSENDRGKSKTHLQSTRSNSNPENAFRGSSKLSPLGSDSFRSGSTIHSSSSQLEPGSRNRRKSFEKKSINGAQNAMESSKKVKASSRASVTSTGSRRGSLQGVQSSNEGSIHFKSEFSRPTV